MTRHVIGGYTSLYQYGCTIPSFLRPLVAPPASELPHRQIPSTFRRPQYHASMLNMAGAATRAEEPLDLFGECGAWPSRVVACEEDEGGCVGE